jgi:hypothetical protein
MGIHHEFWIKRLFKRVFRIIFHMGL